MDSTEDTYLKYRKAKLNPTYLHDKNKAAILKSIKGIEFSAMGTNMVSTKELKQKEITVFGE